MNFDILTWATLAADWFEYNIMDGLLPMLFAPIQAFLMWTGEAQGIMNAFGSLLEFLSGLF